MENNQVHFIGIKEYCSKESLREACSDASTPEVVRFWCKEPVVCTNGFDKYAPIWIENDCDVSTFRFSR
ncbi:egg protein [Schistosoma japonicum]|nr:egg protein [Schistosoma japonicum]KAH8867460.1 egg protein [Schistosoma japonicum]